MLMKNAQNRVIITSDLKNPTVSGYTIYIEEIKNQTATWEKHIHFVPFQQSHMKICVILVWYYCECIL